MADRTSPTPCGCEESQELRAELAKVKALLFAAEHPECITRFEVVDEWGRALTRRPVEVVELSYQDGGRTLKVFLNPWTKTKGSQA